jgi:hypothetical protein
MNNLLKDLTELADKHNLTITNLSIQPKGSETFTSVEFMKDDFDYKLFSGDMSDIIGANDAALGVEGTSNED